MSMPMFEFQLYSSLSIWNLFARFIDNFTYSDYATRAANKVYVDAGNWSCDFDRNFLWRQEHHRQQVSFR